MKNDELCPCRSGRSFGECCGPVISGVRKAATAAELMRARYTAYAVCDVDFLYNSSGPEVREEFNRKTIEEWSLSAKWNGLEIISEEKGGPGDDEGRVAFLAHYSAKGQKCEHRETSTFRRIDGEWRFIDGEIESKPIRRDEPKIGRNDPCPCGSGKKYKKCCGRDK